MQDLLYLTHRIPYPPNKGDKLRSYHLLRYLSSRYRVHLGTFIDDEADWQYVAAVRKLCVEAHFARLRPIRARLRSLAGLFRSEPLSVGYYRDSQLQLWVNRVLSQFPVKHVLIFSSVMAQYVMDAGRVRRIADIVDVDSDKWKQYAAARRWPTNTIYRREAKTLAQYEKHVTQVFDATSLVSKAEAELFKTLCPESAGKIHHVPNGVDTEYFSPHRNYPNPYPETERALVFTGAMDYWPNIDAVVWFAREILPGILCEVPTARFYIVGARPAKQVRKLAALPRTVVTGAVPDIRPYLAHARVAVAPLRLARGVQNKVLEAMAMAIPVVATPQALQGIEARAGMEVLVATDVQEFASRVQQLLAADSVIVAQAGYQRILQNYAWEKNLSRIDRLLKGFRVLTGSDTDGHRTLEKAQPSRKR